MQVAKDPPNWLVVEREQCLPRYRLHNLSAGRMTLQIQARWPKHRHEDLVIEGEKDRLTD